MAYRWLPHTADLKVEITADTLPGVLEQAVAVVRELLAGSSEVVPRASRSLAVSAPSEADLMLAWLRAVLDLYHQDRFVPSRAELGGLTRRPSGMAVSGSVHGEAFDPSRHEAQPEVKAVTRHELAVTQRGDRWWAQVVFDV